MSSDFGDADRAPRIHLSRHFQERQALRGLPHGIAEEIFDSANERFYDTLTEMSVAVKSVEFRGRRRWIAPAYAVTEQAVTFVTLHPLGDTQLANRISSGRWVPHEPEGAL